MEWIQRRGSSAYVHYDEVVDSSQGRGAIGTEAEEAQEECEAEALIASLGSEEITTVFCEKERSVVDTLAQQIQTWAPSTILRHNTTTCPVSLDYLRGARSTLMTRQQYNQPTQLQLSTYNTEELDA